MPLSSRSTTPFSRYLSRLIEISPKTQREIANEVGYGRSNIVTMFKQGATKVPIEKIPALARALDADPTDMLRRALREYLPSTLATIEEVTGELVTANERRVIRILRDSCEGGVVPEIDSKAEARLRTVFD